jgi:hypothetical protein
MHAARPAARTCTAPVVACGGMQLATCLLELLARLSPPSRAPLSSLSRASLLPLVLPAFALVLVLPSSSSFGSSERSPFNTTRNAPLMSAPARKRGGWR